jgi:hypothetical protein
MIVSAEKLTQGHLGYQPAWASLDLWNGESGSRFGIGVQSRLK